MNRIDHIEVVHKRMIEDEDGNAVAIEVLGRTGPFETYGDAMDSPITRTWVAQKGTWVSYEAQEVLV